MLDHASDAAILDRRDLSATPRRVLNVGAGSFDAGKIHAGFTSGTWREVRLDIDPATQPDLVGSVTDLRGVVPDGSFDAVWCSHTLEHLPDHAVVPALAECHRILKPDGFAVITAPDLAAVARHLLEAGAEAVAYRSPAGPITALDMLYGHGRSLRAGHGHMAHRTGFTAPRLGRLALAAGFFEARVGRGCCYDIWALLLKPDPDPTTIASLFGETGLEALCTSPLDETHRA